MQTESFTVRNIKCSGCASTIRRSSSAIPGVRAAGVDIYGARVEVDGETLSRARLAQALSEFGYPEVR